MKLVKEAPEHVEAALQKIAEDAMEQAFEEGITHRDAMGGTVYIVTKEVIQEWLAQCEDEGSNVVIVPRDAKKKN